MLAAFVVVLLARPAAAAAGPTNDPMSGDQAGLIDIKAPQAWARGKGGGTSIAIVSSGIAKEHPDLKDKVDGGFGSEPTKDRSGRGTHLAGIVGATTGNGIGIAGVARDARLLPYKASDPGPPAVDRYAEALDEALRSKPTVVLVDVPVGYSGDKELLRQKLRSVGDAGISVVVGAQTGLALDDLPVLAVAATGPGTGTSRVGPKGVAAPGGDILSTTVTTPSVGDPVYDYGSDSGTGQAAAHVAGAVAILRGIGASTTQAADFLRSTARKGDPSLGAGSIDVAAAANAFKTPPTTTTTKKAATTTTTATAAKAPAGPTGPVGPGAVLSGETPAPGADEAAVAPPGATDPGQVSETGGPSMVVGGHERPWGMLTVGFGLLFGVGTAMSVTFRRLADAAV